MSRKLSITFASLWKATQESASRTQLKATKAEHCLPQKFVGKDVT